MQQHLNDTHLFFLFRNSRAANWSPSKNRFIDANRRSKDMPGPGAYNPSDIDSSQGGYIVSNFRNTGNVKFIKPREATVAAIQMKGGTMRSRTPMNNRIGKCRNMRASCPPFLTCAFRRSVCLTFFALLSDPGTGLLPSTERVWLLGETGWQSAKPCRHPGQSKAKTHQLTAVIDHDGQRQPQPRRVLHRSEIRYGRINP